MKSLILAAALAAAVPAVVLPTTADAQVLTGRGRATSSPPRRRTAPAPRPTLTVDEEVELFDAQSEILAIDARLAEYQRLDSEGALSAEGRAYWQEDHQRREELQARVDVLTAKRDGL